MTLYLLCFIVPMLFGLWAQRGVTNTFRRYTQEPSGSGLTGAEMARLILDRNGLQSVPVNAVPGELSDHYDPRSRSVNLSEPVFGERSVSAVSVAAHEVGHAIQHQKAYAPFQARAAVFPAAALGQGLSMPLIMVGMVLLFLQATALAQYALLAGLALFSFAVLFQLVTLPVEFDASRRAKNQLTELGYVGAGDTAGTAKVLNAAAMTYVAGALAAVAQLAYFAMLFLNSRD